MEKESNFWRRSKKSKKQAKAGDYENRSFYVQNKFLFLVLENAIKATTMKVSLEVKNTAYLLRPMWWVARLLI